MENKRFLPPDARRSHWVSQSLDGCVRAAGSALRRLEGGPDVKVVFRADWPDHAASQVAVVSGGGAGHEPAHAGFVGRGMLTAAVVGEVFASPSIDAVLAAILHVTQAPSSPGCLLVVKNYAGDRINFGLAAERARAPPFNRKVTVVVVGDDFALAKDQGAWREKARGIAGTLFVHKIAGATAETGASLELVTAQASAAANAVVSMGVALSQCVLPGRQLPLEDRIGNGTMELGLGIHGEPGAEKLPIEPVDAIVNRLLDRLPSTGKLAVLINNLGAVPAMEMSIVLDELLRSPLASRIVLLVGPAPLMTSLQMNGFSLSCLSLDGDATWTQKLMEPVGVQAWPQCTALETEPPSIALPNISDPLDAMEQSSNAVTRKLLTAGLQCIQSDSVRQELNTLDGKAGDADAGDTLANAAARILEFMDKLPLNSSGHLCLAVGAILGRSGGGTSGVLLSIFFTAMGSAWTSGADSWSVAAESGVAAMMNAGGAKLGDCTMLDALIPAIEALKVGPREAATAAQLGAEKTAEMTSAAVGRAAYVANLGGVVDPGARAVALILDAFANALEL